MADGGRRVWLFGDAGLLVEVADQQQVHALTAELRARPVAGQRELVPGARSVLVLFTDGVDGVDVAAGRDDLLRRPVATSAAPTPELPVVVIDVVYDGADLTEVGRLTGLGVDGVIAAHTSRPWTVAFGGFLPGFGYLTGGDERLTVPRRTSPRTVVPAGSVGLAGPYSGIYPRESPGGWQLIGRSAAPLWDQDRKPPALLQTGVRVRFRQVGSLPAREEPARDAPAPAVPAIVSCGFEVVRPGIFTTVQDSGRPGYADFGVPVSGAADRAAFRAANQLVGNSEGAAALEVVLGGLSVRAVGDQRVASAGAAAPLLVTRSTGIVEQVDPGVVELRNGDVVKLGSPPRGLRSYLAVRGGIDVPAVLGSRSTDVLTGIGPAVLVRGQRLAVGGGAAGSEAQPTEPGGAGVVATPAAVQHIGAAVLTVRPGPHQDYLDEDAFGVLLNRPWQVTPHSNRVGVRFAGEPIGRAASVSGADTELPSAPLVAGAIQVPPSGELVVFLRDHPTTGGYPVLGVLTASSIDRLAQCRPGETVRFRAD